VDRCDPWARAVTETDVKVWREADRAPAFEHAWLFDHFAPLQGDLDGPCFEGWTLLAALAAQTSRLRLVLMPAHPYPDGIVARLADEVVARVG